MSKKIQIGDLVMVVHVCCDRIKHRLGQIAYVQWVGERELACIKCGYRSSGMHAGAHSKAHGAPFEWLKRIDPPRESEPTTTTQEITA